MPDKPKPAQMVEQFISENFDLEYFQIIDFQLFPYGKRVVDQSGKEIVVFWDYLTNSVSWDFPNRR